jgi:hypothetical protein
MFDDSGWKKFEYDPLIARWAAEAQSVALDVVVSPEMQKAWLQCQGTWFVGVDALPSDDAGKIGEITLRGVVVDWLSQVQNKPMHPAQLSVMYPGYPKPRQGESDSAIGYRLNRDAAHVDGLLPVGTARQRMLKESHAYVLGLPLNKTSRQASPMVIWEGSHIIMAKTFHKAFLGVPACDWKHVDLTDVYKAARRHVFDTCRRVIVHAQPGEAYAVHRLALHGVAPWGAGAEAPFEAPKEGRMIAYLRPELVDASQWANL